MLGGVVTSSYNQATICTSDSGIDKCVGTYIHSDVLHANKGAFSGKRNAEGGFHSRLLVGAPFVVDAAFPGQRMVLDVLRNLGRRSTRIGIDSGQTGMQCSQRESLITQ